MQIPLPEDLQGTLDFESPSIDPHALYQNLTPDQEEQASYPVQGPTAQNRANKAHFGLGTLSPGQKSLEQSIAMGQEEGVRYQAAEGKTAETRAKNLEKVSQAARVGLDLSPQQLAQLITMPKFDPNSVLETTFADQYVKEMMMSSTTAAQASKEDPERAKLIAAGFGRIIAFNEILNTAKENIKAEKEKMGWVSYGVNLVQQVLPGLSATNMSPDKDPKNILLSGESMVAERDKFWSFQNPADAKAWLDNRRKELRTTNVLRNPLDEEDFVNNLIKYSRDQRFLANFIGLLDAQSVGGIAVGTAKLGVAALGLKKLFTRSVKSLDDPFFDPTNIPESVGNLARAGDVRAKAIFQNADPFGTGFEVLAKIPLLTNVGPTLKLSGSRLADDRGEKMLHILNLKGKAGLQAVAKSLRAQRVPDEALPILQAEAEDLILREFPSINDYVALYRPRHVEASNTNFAEVVILNRDGTALKSPDEAMKVADEIGLDMRRFNIVQEEEGLLAANRTAWASHLDKPQDVLSFKTAKGSTYTVKRDGTTIRDKAARTEHPGDAGIKERSKKTVYVTPDDAQKLAPPQGSWRYADHNGQLSLLTRTLETVWGRVPTASFIEYSTTPKQGLVPVELWNPRKLQNQDTYGKVHFGNEITEVKSGTPKDFNFRIVPHGEGYYISIFKPYNEVSEMARGSILPNVNRNPINMGETFLKGITTPIISKLPKGAENILSYFQRQGRHITTHTPQVMFEVIEDMVKTIPKLSRQSMKQLRKVLVHNRDYMDYGTKDRGFAYRSQYDLEKGWYDINKRYPTEVESLAYWSYHQVMDLDWVIRNFAAHRDLSRQGVEMQHTKFTLADPKDPNKTIEQEISFPGKFVPDFPEHLKGDPGFLIVEAGSTAPRHMYYKSMDKAARDNIKDLMKSGHKLLQVANPVDRPFQVPLNKKYTVNFILTKESSSSPLSMKLVDYSPGVHVMYPYTNYVKQMVVEAGERGIARYYGDKTIFGFYTDREAKRFASNLEDFRIELNKVKPDDAVLEAIVSKGLPKDVDYWKKQFTGDDSYLDVNMPIRHTYTNSNILENHTDLKGRFIDKNAGRDLLVERDSEYNLFRSLNVDFMADRDGPLMTVTKRGTFEKPLYELRKADVLDPMVALQRSIGNSITTLINNDSKISAIEQWTQQYSQFLKLSKTAEARENPIGTFYSVSKENFENTIANREQINSAIETRERILSFLGNRSEYGKDVDAFQQYVMRTLGEKGAKIYTEHELRLLKDPLGFIRSVMFDINFGLFNIAQYPIQSSGYFHVVGLAGARPGLAGFAAFSLQKTGMHLTQHPETLQRFAKMSKAFGWRAADFLESYKTMKEIGFDKVGREHALDTARFEPEFWTGYGKRFQKAGRYFFNEGERLTRMTAWNTAFWEFRQKNPHKALTTSDKAQILVRADDLALNMTRASHSSLQEGWKAIPSMYLTFSQRLFEQFWTGGFGSKLGRPTGVQRARAFVMHAAIWGIPTALGGASLVYPFYDQIKEHTLITGKLPFTNISADYLETWYGKVAMEGALSSVITHLTGRSYNVASRYGTNPIDLISKAVTGDLAFGDFLLGPLGSLLDHAFSTFDPAGFGVLSYLRNPETATKATMDNIINIARGLKSFDNAHNALMAIKAGKYLNKRGKEMSEKVTDWDGLALALGLTPDFIRDERLIRHGLKKHKENVVRISEYATKELLTAYKYGAMGDWTKYEHHKDMAYHAMHTFGDFRDEDIQVVYRRVYDDGKDQVERTRQRLLEEGTRTNKNTHMRKKLGLE